MHPCTRYHFVSTDDIAPPEESEFAAQLLEIEKELQSVKETQGIIGGMIYSYSAPEKSVFATHKEWLQELQNSSSTLEKCSRIITNLYSALPFSLEIAHKHMAKIHSIQLQIELSTEKITRLMLLLSSDVYAGSIVSYRRTIRQCQESCTNKENLIKIWNTTKQDVALQSKDLHNLDQRLQYHIRLVHEEITQFYHAACGNDIPIEDCTLDDILDKQCASLTLSKTKKAGLQGLIKNDINERKQEAKAITLKNELTLCPTQYFINISILTKYANYSTNTLVSQLEEEAKELQLIQQTCLATLQMLYHGNWTAFPDEEYPEERLKIPLETALAFNRCTIIKIRKSLYTLIQSGEIEKGLHYAARLLAANQETSYMTSYFFSNIDRKNQLVIRAVNHTFTLLSEVEANKNSSRQLKALLQAAQATAQALLKYKKNTLSMSQFNFKVASCLEIVIARIGNQILEKISSDDLLSMFEETGFNKGNSRKIFKYIEKSIIEWLYFSNKPSNSKLNNVLQVSKESKDYQSLLDKRLKKHPALTALYQSYPHNHEETSDQINHLIENLNLGEDHANNSSLLFDK
ncbi:MAG: hypothetical protein JSR46_00025 [Verrucomicrobia bacterium]|nr:hypothetical protein [Verrucomicrobiota bacterium]